MNVSDQKCDYCGKRKGETNGWWLRQISELEPPYRRLDIFVLIPWQLADPAMKTGGGADCYEHVCSDECVIKAVAKFVNKHRETEMQARQVAEAV